MGGRERINKTFPSLPMGYMARRSYAILDNSNLTGRAILTKQVYSEGSSARAVATENSAWGKRKKSLLEISAPD